MSVILTSESCAPCRMIKQKLLEVGRVVNFLDINTPEGVKKAREYGIRNVPALIKEDGQIIVGAEKILKELEIR